MKIPLTKAITKSIFDGVLSGEGDIFARMASSSIDASDHYAVYPSEVASMVSILKKTVDPNSRLYGMGDELIEAFMEDEENEFLDDEPDTETEE